MVDQLEGLNWGTTESLKRFQLTVDLILRNKINRSNAFEMRMIDEIDSVFEAINSKEHEERWKDISLVINACGKIYGYCVDHIYDETFKILGGVNRASEGDRIIDQKQFFLPKKILAAGSTLEENESAVNFKGFEKATMFDPYFAVMSKRFDSAVAATMILNNTSLNPQLDLVFTADDQVATETYQPGPEEVNLEKIIFFSLDELDSLLLWEDRRTYSEDAIEEVKNRIEEVVEHKSIDDSVTSEAENAVETQEIPQVLNQKSNLEDKIVTNDSFKYIQSPNKVRLSRSILDHDVRRKRNKRKRPKPTEEEPLDFVYSKVKLVVDKKCKNVMRKKEIEAFKIERGLMSQESEFKDSRFGSLFTRNGRFIGVTYVERGERDEGLEEDKRPLMAESAEQIENEESGGRDKCQKGHPNIKELKDVIWKRIQGKGRMDFIEMVLNLPSALSETELENISLHTCFVAVLHLANEFNLALDKVSDISFDITG